jgi:hypothetical protein
MAAAVDQLGVLTSTRDVVDRSRYVRLDEGAIAAIAPGLARRIEAPQWNSKHHFVDGTEKTANWLLVLDALNFSFWGEPRWKLEVGGEKLDGYFGLAAALKRAVDEGVPITDAEYLSNMTLGDLRQVLRGENTIPMIERRLENLHEVGDTLLAKYDGSFARLVDSCSGSAVRLIDRLVTDFLSFDDAAEFEGRVVRFYKRAQILVADLHGAFGGEKWGRFNDLDQLTAFADYKLPQILRHMGLMSYIASLAEKVDNRFLLPPGCREEVEIRSNTIWAVELLRRELLRQGSSLTAYQIDWWLWNESQRFGPADKPYHLVRTVNY